ncbi:succinylglutamate desuccinylase/aspartoacylase family protein [Rhodocista pekingensis]|uniref:Succinylglutamate desuccinylase/aspartoacylase family protein n=1 Tax=Rhodocista pekingensis TaxID=201185 RepID=A0ABW2KVS4_9PROT
MAHTIDDLPLAHGRAGTRRVLRVHRFGTPGARPKAYIQAGLHADETPGHLVAQHLLAALKGLDAAGAVTGEVVLVPVANPIGLDQIVLQSLSGRFELATGVNFNRSYADLSGVVADAVRGRLCGDTAADVALVRQELRRAAEALPAATQADALRRALLTLALDADLMLDLHCDFDAVMHLYTAPGLWEGFRDLAARLGCEAAFLADQSGGHPFDEACSGVWWRLRERLGTDADALPVACAATTIELRGQLAVDDATAARDAAAILEHLRHRGMLAGDPGPAPAPRCGATPLAGVDRVAAPEAGIVLFRVALGDRVEPGQVVAEILEPESGIRHPCRARVAGPVWTRHLNRFVGAGEGVLSIAGTEPLAAPGTPLLTA